MQRSMCLSHASTCQPRPRLARVAVSASWCYFRHRSPSSLCKSTACGIHAGIGRCSGGVPTQHAFPTPYPLQRLGQRPRSTAMPAPAPTPSHHSSSAAATTTTTSSTSSARLGVFRCPAYGRCTAGPASQPPLQGLPPAAALDAAASAAAGPCSSAVVGSLPAMAGAGWPLHSTNSHMRTGVSCAAVRGGRRGLRAPPRPVEVRWGPASPRTERVLEQCVLLLRYGGGA